MLFQIFNLCRYAAVAALGAAVLVQPACGHFRCHMRIAGELMTLKAGDDDLLPGDD